MADTIIVSCPKCTAKMSVPTDYAGLEGHCPKCKKSFVIGESAKPQGLADQPPVAPKIPIRPTPASRSHSLSMAGWICFFIGMALLFLCPIIPFYSPFFLASFVLAIVLLVKEKGPDGLALLLMTLLVPTIVGGLIFMLGVGSMLAAFSGFTKEIESKQKALMTQQTAALKQFSGQQAPFSQSPAPRPAPSQPIFLQPPAASVQPPAVPVQPPAVQPLPAREVSYDGLLKILNKYGDEYSSAQTTVQKKDVRARAQKEVVVFVENAHMILEGKVRDVQFGNDGKADLLFSDFAAPSSAVQANRNLSAYSFGKLPVPITREEALAIKPGQKVRITGRPFVVASDNLVAAIFDEAANPSLITFRFLLDIETLVTLRMRDYTVNFEDKQVQAAPRVKKPYSLVVVPPNATP